MQGTGVYTYPSSGCEYVGEFSMDMKNGKGIYTWKNGTKYEGKWKDNKQHGEGMYTDLNGETKSGIWNEG